MIQGDLPFFESPEDAIRAAVQALGGSKRVGAALWPDKGPEAAARLLMDCLNPSRPEKLDISQVLHILRMAHETGYHAPMLWLAQQCGYEARPVTKSEEHDRIVAVIDQAAKTLAMAMKQLERLRGEGK
jgi:hypothetical protein